MPHVAMLHETDPRYKLLEEVGDVKDFELFNNQVLVVIYIRSGKTKGGILLPGQTTDEDRYQSKVGLVVKIGPTAFDETFKEKFSNVTVDLHDWLVFRPSDGWGITVNNRMCRILDDVDVRGRIQDPDHIY